MRLLGVVLSTLGWVIALGAVGSTVYGAVAMAGQEGVWAVLRIFNPLNVMSFTPLVAAVLPGILLILWGQKLEKKHGDEAVASERSGMRVWVDRTLLLGMFVYLGFGGYLYNEAGYWTRPDMPSGAFSLSYKNGLRAIVVGVPDERKSRRYFGFETEVPGYLEDVWSLCSPPTGYEKAEAERFMEQSARPFERIEAVCRIEADGETVIRGLITSVPNL